jgi:hypothetical protein
MGLRTVVYYGGKSQMLDDHDEGARIGVWVTLGVIALLLFGLIFGLVWRSQKPAAKPVAAASALALADAVLDIPLSGDVIGKVYFDVGKADLPADVAKPLADALAAVTADRDKNWCCQASTIQLATRLKTLNSPKTEPRRCAKR